MNSKVHCLNNVYGFTEYFVPILNAISGYTGARSFLFKMVDDNPIPQMYYRRNQQTQNG